MHKPSFLGIARNIISLYLCKRKENNELNVSQNRVVLYARVSSSENKSNLDSQLERLKLFACAKGYQIVKEIKEKYKKLGKLQDYSFDLSLNTKLSFEYSIELAEKLEIEDTRILHNLSEIDSYFLD